MKALVHTKPFTFEMQEFEVPQIAPNEVLVRVKAVGICGSDVHGMTGKTGRRIPPIIMGHEAAGVIEKVGSAVTGYKAGDRVTFDSTIYCNTCPRCLQGQVNLCENRMVIGVSPGEYRRHGAMAEYVAIPQHILYRLPEGLSYVHAAMIEPVAIGFHAVGRAGMQLNDSVAVVGCGIIGLCILQAAKLAGCGKLYAVDIDERKLAQAESLGADVLINPKSVDAVKKLTELTGGKGLDVCLEAVGANETVNLAINAVKKGGTVVLVGNVSPEVTMPLQRVVTGEITLSGSCASAGEYQACIDMMAAGRIKVEPLVSKVAPLAEGPQWFQTLFEAKEPLLKVVLEP